MNITPTVKEVALSRILHRHDVTRENSRIGLSELKREWTGTGLRTADLVDVLSDYSQRGLLAHEEYAGDRGMVMTAAGLDYLAAGSGGLRQRAERVMAALTLRKAAARGASRGVSRAGRRAGDAPVDDVSH